MTADAVVRDIASAIHVRHIQTPIEQARRITGEVTQQQVASYLMENQFDATPIFSPEPTASVTGLVYREDLDKRSKQPVEHVRRELEPAVLIDASAPLEDLLGRFDEGQPFLFVIGGRGVTGIVTPSDMNRQAGRVHLFLELSALELAMAQALRDEGGDQERWLTCLHPQAQKRALSEQRKARKQDQAVDLIATLHFRDLLLIIRSRGGLSGPWRGLTEPQIDSMNDFRISVMHAVRDVTTDSPPRIEQLISTTQLISQLLQPLLPAPGTEPQEVRS